MSDQTHPLIPPAMKIAFLEALKAQEEAHA